MSVRPATDTDVPAVVPLLEAYCRFYETAPDPAGIERVCRELVRGEGAGALLVAERAGGEIVGVARVAWKLSALQAGSVGYLDDLYVAEEARGEGHGGALLDACAALARERGCRALEWLTMPDNSRARALYDSTGAEPTDLVEYELEL